jgi:signal transduction histidine kinase
MNNTIRVETPIWVNIKRLKDFLGHTQSKSDEVMNYFLISYFIVGLLLAPFYETWSVAIGVGGLSLIAYYSAKIALPGTQYQYVLSLVLGIFMAQYIYQMHGLFEMHFVAFIGSAMLIIYQNWKLQIPIGLFVIIHHGVFAFLQYVQYEEIYFTELEYMNLQTFIIHVLLAAAILYICGLWAYQLKKYSNEIALSNEELRKSNMELDKFVYSVSHDLRAPLSSVLGIIELAEEETSDKVMLDQLSIMKNSINKLDNFVLDILNYSRNSRLEVKKTKVLFKEMLDDIALNLKYMNRANTPIDIQIVINESGTFESDQSRLNIVLNNLISNAIRYSNSKSANPFVRITVDANEERAKVKVKDNGIGIRKDLQEKVFNMFYRVSENSEGSGLGLYIVKEAVEKLNGQISLESELGHGSEFTLVIPGSN